jgi:hypothetical protein
MSKQTVQSLKWLRNQGYEAGVVERWIDRTKQRVDLFGAIDIIATNGNQTLAVQSGPRSNHAAHRTKVLASSGARLLHESGVRVLILSWDKTPPKRHFWRVKTEYPFEVEEGDKPSTAP